MVLAAYMDNGYKVMVAVHILCFIVAFAPSFVWPFVARRLRQDGDQDIAGTINRLAGGNSVKIYGPAAALGGILGFGIAGMSKIEGQDEPFYSLADPWLSAAAVLWFLLLGIFFGLLGPAEKRIAAGDGSATKIANAAGGAIHLIAAVALYLMVFKPGA